MSHLLTTPPAPARPASTARRQQPVAAARRHHRGDHAGGPGHHDLPARLRRARASAASYRFQPGQFNMLYLPGIGESAISISSDPAEPETLLHTIRAAGNVTQALARKKVGDQIGLRGPFGSSWPMDACKGQDVVIACGGVGLAPLRPAIYHIIRHRSDYGRVILLYGARTPGDLLYASEYDAWRDADIEVETTVDIGDGDWRGNIGVVPVLFYRLRLNAARTHVLTCGPRDHDPVRHLRGPGPEDRRPSASTCRWSAT